MFEVRAEITVKKPEGNRKTLTEVLMRTTDKETAYSFADALARGTKIYFNHLMDETTRQLTNRKDRPCDSMKKT